MRAERLMCWSGAGLYDSHAFVCLSCIRYILSFSNPLAASGCGSLLIFHLTF